MAKALNYLHSIYLLTFKKWSESFHHRVFKFDMWQCFCSDISVLITNNRHTSAIHAWMQPFTRGFRVIMWMKTISVVNWIHICQYYVQNVMMSKQIETIMDRKYQIFMNALEVTWINTWTLYLYSTDWTSPVPYNLPFSHSSGYQSRNGSTKTHSNFLQVLYIFLSCSAE